jgi:hypothetical protein
MEFDKQECTSDEKTVDGQSRKNANFLPNNSNNGSNSETSSFLNFDNALAFQLKLINATTKSPLALS